MWVEASTCCLSTIIANSALNHRAARPEGGLRVERLRPTRRRQPVFCAFIWREGAKLGSYYVRIQIYVLPVFCRYESDAWSGMVKSFE